MNCWYMQVHPGSDPGSYGIVRMRDVIRQWRDVGMGGPGWREGANTRRVFREEVDLGDVIAVADGRHFIALVRVVGGYRTNRHITDSHWLGVVRSVEVLCDNPEPYESAYTRLKGVGPQCIGSSV